MKNALLIMAAALASSSGAAAQTTFATITGMVTDPQGAAISGAPVTATLVSSNYQYKTRSNELGYYTLGQLLQGEYTLRVEMQGFSGTLVKDIQLTAQEQRRIDVQLTVSTISTTVVVNSTAAPIWNMISPTASSNRSASAAAIPTTSIRSTTSLMPGRGTACSPEHSW